MTTPRLTERVDLPDCPFAVATDEEKLAAHISRRKSGDWELTGESFAELLARLSEAGFKGIDEEGLRKAIPDVLDGKPFRFARGVEPVDGADGCVKCHFETDPVEKIWAANDAQQIDFRRRNEINNVKEGDLLAEVVTPTPPKSGVNVMGEVLEGRPGRPARLVAGRNVRLSDDKQRVFAGIDGCVTKIGRKIAVHNVKTIQGDIDFHTGNIDFNGDVVVAGDVKETFSIKAAGNICVAGGVDRAELRAGGNICVEGGLYGKDGIVVEADGNISLGFAENANIRAGGSIYVRSSLINCQVEAGSKILLKAVGKSLIGGRIKALYGVDANSLGNPRIPTKTIVEFGKSCAEEEQRLRSIEKEMEEIGRQQKGGDQLQRKRLKALNAAFEDLKADARRAGGQDAEATQGLRVMAAAIERMKSDQEWENPELAKRLAELAEEYEDHRAELLRLQRARVNVRHVAYPGVVFVSGKAAYEVKNEISRMVFQQMIGKNEIAMHAMSKRKDEEE